MKNLLATLLVGAFVVVGSSAMAQDEEVQTRFYDFNDMLIDGELQRPEGAMMSERESARFESLLNLDQSFVEEIEKGAEESALE
jgi:hypothetical protein